MACALAAAPRAWAADPTAVDAGSPSAPFHISVTGSTWHVNASNGTVSGAGTLDLVLAGTAHPLDATWSGATFNAAANVLTAGTISLTPPNNGTLTVAIGLDVKISALSLDASTGAVKILVGQIAAPALPSGLGFTLTMPSPISLAGIVFVSSSTGLSYVEVPVQGSISALGVTFGPGATLGIDLSDTQAAPIGTILPDHIGSPADDGKAWQGIHFKDATVAFGGATPAAGAATLLYLSVGWANGISGTPAFRGEVVASLAKPLSFALLGVTARLSGGTLTFDSSGGAAAVSGTFDATITLPGAQPGEHATLAPGEKVSIAYGALDELQFVVEHTAQPGDTAAGFAAGTFAAHAKHFGIDASAKKTLAAASVAALATLSQADRDALLVPAWTGVVVFDGDLALPLPWAVSGGPLALAVKDLVIGVPLPPAAPIPWDVSGWFVLEADIALVATHGFGIEAAASKPPAVAELPGPPADLAGRTCFQLLHGALASGSLYGELTVPGIGNAVPFGGTVDEDGGVIAEITIPEIEIPWPAGEGDFKFTDVTADLDLSASANPPSVNEPETWTGLALQALTAALPSFFGTTSALTVTASGFAWSDGPLGTLTVSSTNPNDTVSALGVRLALPLTLRVDGSGTEELSGPAVQTVQIGGPSAAPDVGKAWRGIWLTAPHVAFGTAAVSGGAPLDYLSVGWVGTGALTYHGRISTTVAAPLTGKVSGVEVSITSGTLTMHSTQTPALSGTAFGGTIMLPGAQDGGGGTTAGFSGLSVAYERGQDFQFVVDHVIPPPGFGLGIGDFGAHVSDFGVDASQSFGFTASTDPNWMGVVIHAGDLAFPMPGIHDGTVLVLGLTDLVIPLGDAGSFSGWLTIQGNPDAPDMSISELTLTVLATNPGVASVKPSDAPAGADKTYFHFENGALVSGCLYGRLTSPLLTSPVIFGGTVDEGGVMATVHIGQIVVGQGSRAVTLSDINAVIDFSETQTPLPTVPGVTAPSDPHWTGLLLETAEATLPWPFQSTANPGATIQVKGLLWDRGITGLFAIDAGGGALASVGIKDSKNFQLALAAFSIRFLHGDVEAVSIEGQLQAQPFLDWVDISAEYDAAKGLVLKAMDPSPNGPHAFGSHPGLPVNLRFSALALELPSFGSSGGLPTLRMDGSLELPTTSFAFENFRLRSDGTVDPGGGWIDLRDRAHWEFMKFGVDVREIGCGSYPVAPGVNQVWLGLSGGLALSDAWGISVDVQADKFRWFAGNGGFAVEEVRVKASVKNTVTIDGKVKYLESGTKKEFRGQVDVTISVASASFQAEVQFVSGHDRDIASSTDYAYWGVSGSFTMASLGVPIGNTGLALYGVNGGVSHHLTPTSVNLYDWTPSFASGYAFQAGVTIGTYPDMGYTLHANVTLTVLFEPLIIRIDGVGNLLTAMGDSSNMDRIVKASMVYDSTSSTFDLSLELGESDQHPFQFPHLASVHGLAAMHVGPDGAYLHVGTRTSPVTARIFPDVGGGITASSWFMVDWVRASDTFTIAVGAHVGWSFTKEFKVCDVTGEIAAGGDVTVTVKPAFGFSGNLSASIGAHACGLGFDLSADCSVGYPPIHLHAACTLEVQLLVKTVTLSANVDQP